MAAPAGFWRSRAAQAAKSGGGPAPAAPRAQDGGGKGDKQAAAGDGGAGKSSALSADCDERLLFAAAVLIGYRVKVQLKSGAVYEGIFHGIKTEGGGLQVQLRVASLAQDAAAAAAAGEFRTQRPVPQLTVPAADLVQLVASDVAMGEGDVGPLGWDDAGGFGTDAAISRSRGAWGQERELQRWLPDDESQMVTLEESGGGVGRGWDQFSLNERKFGLRTDYAEELYTTQLDPSKSRISVAEAERIAGEIERGGGAPSSNMHANMHMREERGMAVDDSQMDEEERYGAVVREAPPPAGPRSASNGVGAGPRPAGAWSRGAPGGAAAAVRPALPGQTPSAPIAIDTRREANKLRAQLTQPKQASPYGTPTGKKSPLSSPLINDPSKLEALNLDPGLPRVDESTRRDFEQYKLQQAAARKDDMKTNLASLKSFSHQIEGKLSKSLSSEGKVLLETMAAARHSPPQPEAAPSTSAGAGASAEAPAAKPASKPLSLNPFAKEFTLNINAKSFNSGGFGGGGGSAAATPAAAPPSSSSSFTPAAAAAVPPPRPMAMQAPHAATPSGGHMAGPYSSASGHPAAGGGSGYRAQGGPPPGAAGPRGQPHYSPPEPRPDYRNRGMQRADSREGADLPPHRYERDGSFGRRREDRDERFDRRRHDMRPQQDGPHHGGAPPPPPPKGSGSMQGSMQMGPMMGPGMMGGMMPMMGQPGMVMMGPQGMMLAPGQAMPPGQQIYMVRPMMMPQGGMGMPPQMMMTPQGMVSTVGSPGRPRMVMPPQMMMVPGGGMMSSAAGMMGMPPGSHAGMPPGGKPGSEEGGP